MAMYPAYNPSVKVATLTVGCFLSSERHAFKWDWIIAATSGSMKNSSDPRYMSSPDGDRRLKDTKLWRSSSCVSSM
eukprot:1337703-Prymnesium_polylepis.2